MKILSAIWDFLDSPNEITPKSGREWLLVSEILTMVGVSLTSKQLNDLTLIQL